MANDEGSGHREYLKAERVAPLDVEATELLLDDLAAMDSSLTTVQDELDSGASPEQLQRHVDSAVDRLDDVRSVLADQAERDEF